MLRALKFFKSHTQLLAIVCRARARTHTHARTRLLTRYRCRQLIDAGQQCSSHTHHPQLSPPHPVRTARRAWCVCARLLRAARHAGALVQRGAARRSAAQE
jgi:hypothetical protein